MKKLQTIFSVIVSSALLFNINFPYVCNAEAEKITTLYDIYSLQETAQKEYNKMMYEFASNSNAVMTCGTTEVIMDMEIDYPDNYAGACFNADGSQKLDIYLTDDNNDAYLEILDQNAVNFHNAEFSMDELIYAKELIDSYMIEYDIATVSLIQKENTIRVVGNEDFDYNNFYGLIAELDIDTDIYTVDDNIANNAVTKSIAMAGTEVKCVGYNGSGTPSGTIGFNAYNTRTKKFGIVTAGHLLTGVSNERLVYVNDQIVNSVGSATKVDTGTSYDAAFIPFHSMDKWDTTNKFTTPVTFGWIKSYSYLDNMLPKDLEGITLTKSGAKSGMEEGKIISTSTSFSYHDKKSDTDKIVYDTIYCENYNESGDSGGPVGITSRNGSPYTMSIVGITTGTDGSENYYNSDGEFIYAGRSYVSKITNIIGNLGVEIVTIS